MILSKNYNDINSIYDFYEGIISNIYWDDNLVDLLVMVYYYFDEPYGLKDKNVILRFKKCSTFNCDCSNMITTIKELNIVTPHPEIERITMDIDGPYIKVEISTNYDSPMISLSCDEIWIESTDD